MRAHVASGETVLTQEIEACMIFERGWCTHIRTTYDIDAAGQGSIAFMREERLASLVNADQGARAGCIHYHRRPTQTEVVRDAPTKKRTQRPRGIVYVQVPTHPINIIPGSGANVATERAFLETLGCIRNVTSVLQSMVGTLQQYALLRVHGIGFAGRDIE